MTTSDTESARDSMYEKNGLNKIGETRFSGSTHHFDLEGIRSDKWAYTIGLNPNTVRRAMKSRSHRSLQSRLSNNRLSNSFLPKSHRVSARESNIPKVAKHHSNNSRVQGQLLHNTHDISSGIVKKTSVVQHHTIQKDQPRTGATEEIKVWKIQSQNPSRDALSNNQSRAMDSNKNNVNIPSSHDWDTSYRPHSPAFPELSVANVSRHSTARGSRVHPYWMASGGSQRRRPLSPLNTSQLWATSP